MKEKIDLIHDLVVFKGDLEEVKAWNILRRKFLDDNRLIEDIKNIIRVELSGSVASHTPMKELSEGILKRIDYHVQKDED